MKPVALVTGSSRGIGLGLCRGLLERGFTVWASARDPACPGLGGLVADFGHAVRPLALDVCDDASIARALESVAHSGDLLDLLVHNAGVGAAGEAGLATLERGKILQVMNTNVVGPLVLTRALLPWLRQPGATVAALTSGRWGEPPPLRRCSQYSYGVSKQALWMALHCLRGDLEPLGIRVLGLNPGFVKTDMTKGSPVEPPLTVEESVKSLFAALFEPSQEFPSVLP